MSLRTAGIDASSSFERVPAKDGCLKGFGCRPEHERLIRYKAGVRKPRKKEPAGKQ
jgi:hypothetical protein